MLALNFPPYHFSIETRLQKKTIFDNVRKKFVVLTPEEWVRQHVIQFLASEIQVPLGLLAVEKQLQLNGMIKRTDIVAYNQAATPLLLVECKAPDVVITQQTFEQIARYNLTLQVPYLMVTNGLQHYYCRIDWESRSVNYLRQLPLFSEM